MVNNNRIVMAFLFALLLAAPAGAQRLQLPALVDEYVAGAAGNLALRGPWISPAFRQPIPRLMVFTALSAFYEIALDPYHPDNVAQGWIDWGQREAGYLATELIVLGVRQLVRLVR